MKDLLRMIAAELVDHPEEVSVSQKEVDSKIVLELRVAPEDMGKVIGRQGRRFHKTKDLSASDVSGTEG